MSKNYIVVLVMSIALLIPHLMDAKTIKRSFLKNSQVWWEVTDNGELIIGGNGEIPDFAVGKYGEEYKKNGLSPWNKKKYWDRIHKVKILEGITSIGKNAFNGMMHGRMKIKSFELPSTIKRVGDKAFAYSAISSFDLNKLSGASLGECLFWCCENLTNVNIPSTWIRITPSLFYRCDNLVNVSIPEGIKEIGANAFTCCFSLRSIKLPQSLKKIGRKAFSMTPLQSISFPEKLEEIGDEAFWSCKSLTEVRFPSSLKTIGQKAFSCCENLESISMNDGVLQIGDFAFVGCKKLTRIRLSSNAQVGKSIFNSSDWEYPRFRWRFDGVILGLPISFNEDNCFNKYGITKESFRKYKEANTPEAIIKRKGGYASVTEMNVNGKKYYKVSNAGRYGLTNFNGKVIVPVEMETIELAGSDYIRYKKDGGWGISSINGKEIIPTNRYYTFIGNLDKSSRTFAFTKKGYTGKCDEQGREISLTRLAPTTDDIKASGGYSTAIAMNNGNIKYYKVSKSGRYGLTDAEGKVIVPVEMDALESAGTGYLRYKLNGFWGLMNYQGKILIDTDRGYTSIGDFKTFNKRFAYTMNGYKGECDVTGRQISKIKVDTPRPNTSVASSSSSSSGSSSSSSSSGNSNSGNKTTTVVVEHHRDPVPVQEWHACWACGGMGTMGCDFCGGGGTKYIGDRLHRCSRCNGRGIIPCNICYGNKGQYVTVYK